MDEQRVTHLDFERARRDLLQVWDQKGSGVGDKATPFESSLAIVNLYQKQRGIALTIEDIRERLAGIVSKEYKWPSIPADGYQVEFIQHSNGELLIDFSNEEKAILWSEESDEFFQPPFTDEQQPITWKHLKMVGIPFLS